MLGGASWYVQRARAMTGREMLYRARLRLRSERQRRAAGRWPVLADVLAADVAAAGPDAATVAFALFRRQHRLAASGSAADAIAWLRRERPDSVSATLRAAASIQAGEVCLFGRTNQVGTRPDWTRDPFTQRAWPLVYWTGVNYRGGRAKYVWELNRQQHLPTLARAYRLTGDGDFAALALDHIAGWIGGNPYLRGINWTSGLELALRLISWAWTLDLLADANALTPDFFNILVAVHGQASFIARNLSRYSSANNHLIGEAAGLVAAGTLFPMLRDAPHWRELGARIISEETPRQIHADGGSAEQAVHYLAFVCDLVLHSVLLLKRAGLSYADVVDKRLRAAADFLGDMAADGGPFHVGDSDDAQAVSLDDEPSAIASTCARLAVHTGSVGAARAGRHREAAVVWLFGPEGATTLRDLASQPYHRRSRHTYAESGYTLFTAHPESGNGALLFDHGPLGYLSQAAHGHADALAVCYSQGGVPLLIDPGTGTYHEDRRVRDYFRGTAAHNTIAIDGHAQSEPTGPTIWGRKARVHDLRAGTAGDVEWVSAVHDGYERLPAPVRHRRSVIALGSAFVVVDELLGPAAQHHIELGWHLPIGADCALEGAAATISHRGQRLRIQMDLPAGCTAIRIRGQETPTMQGWVSERYGDYAPAWAILASGTVSTPITLVTLLAAEARGVRLLVATRGRSAGEPRAVLLTVGDEQTWRLRLLEGRVAVVAEPDEHRGERFAETVGTSGTRELEG